jgi:general secretion pathway protein H
MPTSAPGNNRRLASGFTLIELVVVLAVIAVAAGLIVLTVRDPTETRLENEAARLSALLESARSEARAAGLMAIWVPGSDARSEPFRFVGLPAALHLPTHWMDEGVSAEVVGRNSLVLGPEAILPPQRVILRLDDRSLEIGSDGLAPFGVLPPRETPQ